MFSWANRHSYSKLRVISQNLEPIFEILTTAWPKRHPKNFSFSIGSLFGEKKQQKWRYVRRVETYFIGNSRCFAFNWNLKWRPSAILLWMINNTTYLRSSFTFQAITKLRKSQKICSRNEQKLLSERSSKTIIVQSVACPCTSPISLIIFSSNFMDCRFHYLSILLSVT